MMLALIILEIYAIVLIEMCIRAPDLPWHD
jgi:hypothetical protein